MLLLTYFTSCSSVFIVNFEQVNPGWVGKKHVKVSDSKILIKQSTKLTKAYFKQL